MFAIAGGIILALVILALLANIDFVLPVCVVLALVVTAGYFFFTNLSTALITCFLILVGTFIALMFSVYAKSRNVALFFRGLALRLMITTSIRKRAEKEAALEQLAKDIEAHCASRNAVIVETAFVDVLAVANRVWKPFREYGELAHFRDAEQIRFKSAQIGELFSVKVAANFPRDGRPTVEVTGVRRHGPELGSSARKLRSAMKRTVKLRLLEFEREKLRKQGLTDGPSIRMRCEGK